MTGFTTKASDRRRTCCRRRVRQLHGADLRGAVTEPAPRARCCVAVLASSGVDEDGRLVELVRTGDEAAFADLIRRYQPRLLRFAEATVGSHAIAEEVCQDTWLAVVRGVDRFEGRSSFKTWLFRILLNRARTGAAPGGASGPTGRPGRRALRRLRRMGVTARPMGRSCGRAPRRRGPGPSRPPSAPRACPNNSVRSWCCATSKAFPRPRWRRCSASATRTSECSSTGAGPPARSLSAQMGSQQ